MRFKHWFALFKSKQEILIQLDFLKNQIESAKKESRKAQEEFDRTLEQANTKFAELRDKALSIEKSKKALEHSLDGANQKLEILEEITIPNLMKLLATYSSNWDCQSSQNAMRTALAETRTERPVE